MQNKNQLLQKKKQATTNLKKTTNNFKIFTQQNLKFNNNK